MVPFKSKGVHPLPGVLFVLGLMLLVVSCASAVAPDRSTTAPREGAPAQAQQPGKLNQDQLSNDRMIIRTVALSLLVGDVDEVVSEASRLASEMGGYVVSSDNNVVNGKRTARITVRVPSRGFDEALVRIKGLAQTVERETQNAKDVTEEYVDQDARLRNLRATESQYLEVLGGAKTIDEILTVRKALSEVREQIERTEGRLQFLRQSVEMTNISLDVFTSPAAQQLQIGDWNFFTVVRQAVQGLINVGVLLVTLAVWLVVLAPIWLPAYFLLRWWFRYIHRRPVAPSGGPS